MGYAILWLLPLIFFAFGFTSRLLTCFFRLLGISLAVYVGILTGPHFAPAILRSLPEEAQNAQLEGMLSCWITAAVVFLILAIVGKMLNRESEEYAFPEIINRFGGAICGALSGVGLTNFLVLLVLLTPFREKLPVEADPAMLERVSVTVLTRTLHTVDRMSFQRFTEKQRQELLAYYLYVPPEDEEENPNSGSGASRPPARTAPQTGSTGGSEAVIHSSPSGPNGAFFNRIRGRVNATSDKHNRSVRDAAK